MTNTPESSDKWFAGFIAVAITIAGFLGVALLISLEMAIWGAGFGNFLVWHTAFSVIGIVSYGVYHKVLRSLP